MMTLFLLGYILPLIIMFIYCYKTEEVVTVKDLLNCWWVYLLPVVNILSLSFITIYYIIDNSIKRINWNWLNKELKK